MPDMMSDTVLYEAKTSYDTWMKALLGFPIFVFLVEMYFLGQSSTESIYIMASVIIFLGIIYWLVLPRSYRIYNDSVRVVLGWPCSIKIGFSTITAASRLKGVGVGMNLAGSTKNAVTINRKKRMPVHISPDDPDVFISNLDRELQEWRRYYDKSS
jgi:hypothetical protein